MSNPEVIKGIQQEAFDARASTVERLISSANHGQLGEVLDTLHSVRARNKDPRAAFFEKTEVRTIEELKALAEPIFDFRTAPDGSYRERWEVEDDAENLLRGISDEEVDSVKSLAFDFGLSGDTRFKDKNMDGLIVLGGGNKSPLLRTQYAYDLLDKGLVSAPQVIGLGSERVVDEAERQRAGDYAEGAETEFDLLRAAFERVFGAPQNRLTIDTKRVQTQAEGVPDVQRIGRYDSLSETDPALVLVSSAVITNPYRTATSEDGTKRQVLRNRSSTQDALATLVKESILLPGDNAGIVTNQIYVPFQGADAAGILGKYGVRAECVGFSPEYFGDSPKPVHELTQELLTLISRLSD